MWKCPGGFALQGLWSECSWQLSLWMKMLIVGAWVSVLKLLLEYSKLTWQWPCPLPMAQKQVCSDGRNVLWHFVECLSHVYVTAVLGEDFTEPSPLQVTFSSGNLVGDTACTTFGIINDNNLEFDHEFTVNLESVTPTGPVISNSSSTAVSIMDDEGMHCVV